MTLLWFTQIINALILVSTLHCQQIGENLIYIFSSKSVSAFFTFLYQLISIFYIYMQQLLFRGRVAGSVGFSIEKNDLEGGDFYSLTSKYL